MVSDEFPAGPPLGNQPSFKGSLYRRWNVATERWESCSYEEWKAWRDQPKRSIFGDPIWREIDAEVREMLNTPAVQRALRKTLGEMVAELRWTEHVQRFVRRRIRREEPATYNVGHGFDRLAMGMGAFALPAGLLFGGWAVLGVTLTGILVLLTAWPILKAKHGG